MFLQQSPCVSQKDRRDPHRLKESQASQCIELAVETRFRACIRLDASAEAGPALECPEDLAYVPVREAQGRAAVERLLEHGTNDARPRFAKVSLGERCSSRGRP